MKAAALLLCSLLAGCTELVVIGSRGLSGLKAALKGSVAHHLGAHSHAPVLIVPPDESD